MNFLNRNDAINFLVEKELVQLSKFQRKEILEEWWSIDDKDEEFILLPKLLQNEILEFDEPVDDVMDSKYEPILEIALKYRYIGITNSYLEKKMGEILNQNIQVCGDVEILYSCPCCKYRTIKERGQYEVCPVCHWEDDGNDDLTKYSSPNHMTLKEYKLKKDLTYKENDKYL